MNKSRLLFCDDHQVFRETYRSICTYIQRTGKSVASLKEMLLELQTRHYDAVFLDLNFRSPTDTRGVVPYMRDLQPSLLIVGLSAIPPKEWCQADRDLFDETIDRMDLFEFGQISRKKDRAYPFIRKILEKHNL